MRENHEKVDYTYKHTLLSVRVTNSETVLTLCFVMAPTISGQTIPDKVPTPLEIPMRILAYRGAMSRWLTLKPCEEPLILLSSCDKNRTM